MALVKKLPITTLTMFVLFAFSFVVAVTETCKQMLKAKSALRAKGEDVEGFNTV